MERLRQDLVYAFRLLLKDRAFTSTTLLTLALCVGANAAIFAVVNSVVLRPLPTPEADRLVSSTTPTRRPAWGARATEFPTTTIVFAKPMCSRSWRSTTNGASRSALMREPQRLQGMIGRPSLYRLLRARPLRGRIFTEAEGEQGQDRKVILSYGLWQRMFGGSESTIGRSLRLGGVPYEIVGIMAADFHFVISRSRAVDAALVFS